jgi:hypothetical protein
VSSRMPLILFYAEVEEEEDENSVFSRLMKRD